MPNERSRIHSHAIIHPNSEQPLLRGMAKAPASLRRPGLRILPGSSPSTSTLSTTANGRPLPSSTDRSTPPTERRNPHRSHRSNSPDTHLADASHSPASAPHDHSYRRPAARSPDRAGAGRRSSSSNRRDSARTACASRKLHHTMIVALAMQPRFDLGELACPADGNLVVALTIRL